MRYLLYISLVLTGMLIVVGAELYDVVQREEQSSTIRPTSGVVKRCGFAHASGE